MASTGSLARSLFTAEPLSSRQFPVCVDNLRDEHKDGNVELTEPQVWTLIGIFAAVMLGAFTLMLAVFRQSLVGLRGEMTSMRNELIARMDSGFDSVHRRIDHLDSDVQLLMRREFGDNRS